MRCYAFVLQQTSPKSFFYDKPCFDFQVAYLYSHVQDKEGNRLAKQRLFHAQNHTTF